MEGPTPVSALIHAATMVTAGVYMVARMNPLFPRAPVGHARRRDCGRGHGVLFAATIGLVQTDIKKVLAYSTVSQLGYMFLACGVGAFGAGIFHLMTHAFFKGLLFLAAGSVIHAMGGEQDMCKMGGLRKKIPVHVLDDVHRHAGHCRAFRAFPDSSARTKFSKPLNPVRARIPCSGLLGVVGAGLTSFYMFRLLFLTFFGKPRYDEHKVHVHESPKNMTRAADHARVPLDRSAAGSPRRNSLAESNHFENFLAPVFSAYAPAAGGSRP